MEELGSQEFSWSEDEILKKHFYLEKKAFQKWWIGAISPVHYMCVLYKGTKALKGISHAW